MRNSGVLRYLYFTLYTTYFSHYKSATAIASVYGKSHVDKQLDGQTDRQFKYRQTDRQNGQLDIFKSMIYTERSIN